MLPMNQMITRNVEGVAHTVVTFRHNSGSHCFGFTVQISMFGSVSLAWLASLSCVTLPVHERYCMSEYKGYVV